MPQINVFKPPFCLLTHNLSYTQSNMLILFTVNQDIGLGVAQIINNEAIATEIIRTLAGSMGLALAFPITTWLAVYFLE